LTLHAQPQLPDTETYVFNQLSRIPNVYVGAENNPDITIPAIIYSVDPTGQTGNSPRLWLITVTVNVVDDDPGNAWALTKTVYDTIHSWANTIATDLGHIAAVNDTTPPSSGSDQNTDSSKAATQYSAIYELLVDVRTN
jgi:hypothetical protein